MTGWNGSLCKCRKYSVLCYFIASIVIAVMLKRSIMYDLTTWMPIPYSFQACIRTNQLHTMHFKVLILTLPCILCAKWSLWSSICFQMWGLKLVNQHLQTLIPLLPFSFLLFLPYGAFFQIRAATCKNAKHKRHSPEVWNVSSTPDSYVDIKGSFLLLRKSNYLHLIIH